MRHFLTIGAVSDRTGVATSAIRYYESEGLIHSERSEGNQRRFSPDMIRRISFIQVAQQVGLSLNEIHEALDSLPENRTPNEKDWAKLAASWRPRLEYQIGMLERLRDKLDGCIGCGCLSLKHCRLMNPDDELAAHGPGPRTIIEPD